MKRILFVLASTIAIAIAGCSSNPPVIDYDSSVNFSGYKTYAFISDHPLMRSEGSPPGSPLLEGRLMRIVEDNLNAKGFALVANSEAADFAIGFTVGARDKIKVNSYPEPYRPYYGGWGGWGAPYYGGGYGGSNVDVQQYVEGTLAIDIYDVSEHKPAWHGVATKRVTDSMRRNPDETLTEIVNEILAGFPPGAMVR
ncbi:DUF4136 domain-containing protein [Congregibacter variabilis]|uniref:DUF4136 domain-containing protein n=1 Tax=Congregibacter variabilis TaxID=3081200 RepID=A0ABZ0HZX5_9GAMM|nr:DUF4136 domain-containing protein [Congregibacter sp. IMCC43200]